MIKNKISAYYRLAKGVFVPFLLPYFDEQDIEAARRWMRSEAFPDAEGELKDVILSGSGKHWSVRFFNLGRTAIQKTLEALDLPLGSEVIMPSFSCASVAMAIIQAKMTPVFVDMDDDFNIRLDSVLEADSSRVKALILPHLSGCWAKDCENIIDWARKRGVFVIEDCAQSFGLECNGKTAGTFADISIFSSGLGKTIFGPGGGWVMCRDDKIAKRISSIIVLPERRDDISDRMKRFIKLYFTSKRHYGVKILQGILSYKFLVRSGKGDLGQYSFPVHSMSDIEAQLALFQIRKADSIIKRQSESYERWRFALQKTALTGIRLLPAQHNIHTKMFVRFTGNSAKEEHDILKGCLWSCGVELESAYTPLHLRTGFNHFRRSSMVFTEEQCKNCFCLPTRPSLNEDDWSIIEEGLSRMKKYLRTV